MFRLRNLPAVVELIAVALAVATASNASAGEGGAIKPCSHYYNKCLDKVAEKGGTN